MAETESKKEGIILVNKPRGMTSHDVVDCVRGKFGIKKVGHAGTLDPQASGLLIILVGRYTKFFGKFAGFDKEYRGVMKLGQTTTTGDAEGKVITEKDFSFVSEDDIAEVFARYRGEIEQVPPMVSAVRVKGRRLYELARKGIVIEREPRKIVIHELRVSSIDLPFIEFYVKCSKGTYIRKLAEDIGDSLGCGGHVVDIVRLGIGPFSLGEAASLDALDKVHIKSWPLNEITA